MAKPRLEKVRALFYIISVYYKKRDCVYFDTASRICLNLADYLFKLMLLQSH